MTELVLDRDERLALRAKAHVLDPVVLLGAAGLSAAVLAEIDRALASHGLIKVRIAAAGRDEREAILAEIADRLGAARVQSIGKLGVLFRPAPEEPQSQPVTPARRNPQGRAGTRASGGSTRGAAAKRPEPERRTATAAGRTTRKPRRQT